MSIWKKLFGNSPTPPDSAREMSRNAACWCGSDKKYKHCHFEDDRSYFTAKRKEGVQGPR